jgi:hypothetical protein
MLVTLLGIMMEVRDGQYWKVHPTILVTLFGIVTEVSEEHHAKA